MYSVIMKDKTVEDVKYKKQSESIYSAWLGDVLICQLFKVKRNGWSAVVHDSELHEETPVKVDGFGCREYALEYALLVHSSTNRSFKD